MSAQANANLQQIAQGETYAVGNLNIQNNTAATSNLPQVNSSGFIVCPNTANIKISGRDPQNGNRRVLIVFTMAISTTANPVAPLQVLDQNGCQFMTIQQSQVIALACDADLYISGLSGTAQVTVGQVFLKNSK
jgi:hypothetical protein